MTSRNAFLLIATMILVVTGPSYSQEESRGPGAGISFGMASPLVDIDDQQDGPLGRFFLRYYASPAVGLEIGAGMGSLKAEADGHYFSSTIYPIDARIVLQPIGKSQFQPFLFGGIGLLVFDPEDQQGDPLPRNANGEYSTTTAYVPVGVGGEYYLNERYAFGLTGTYNMTMTDNLDDIELEGNDSFWAVSIQVFAFMKATDNDPDKDKLLTDEERKIGTDPMNPDTDGDGLKDGEEVMTYKTDPLNPDTDGDKLRDGEEVFQYKTDPLDPDSDDDGLDDGYEVLTPYSAADPGRNIHGGFGDPAYRSLLALGAPGAIGGAWSSDGHLVLASLGGIPAGARRPAVQSNGQSNAQTTPQSSAQLKGTDPLNPDTDGDGLNDGQEVLTYRSNPLKPDTDGDGLLDGDEVNARKTDPIKADTDGDGLSDGDEVLRYLTNPLVADTDNGGVPDGKEIQLGTNPLDAADDVPIIKVGERIILEGVNFETNKATLLPGAQSILDQVANSLLGNPEAEVAIHGHTDNVGGAKYNQDLSLRRAEAVKAYLASRGVPASKMSTRGYGFTKPIDDNSTQQGRAKNRRIEFVRIK